MEGLFLIRNLRLFQLYRSSVAYNSRQQYAALVWCFIHYWCLQQSLTDPSDWHWIPRVSNIVVVTCRNLSYFSPFHEHFMISIDPDFLSPFGGLTRNSIIIHCAKEDSCSFILILTEKLFEWWVKSVLDYRHITSLSITSLRPILVSHSQYVLEGNSGLYLIYLFFLSFLLYKLKYPF